MNYLNMPSLSALGNFKSSFNKIANEVNDLAAGNLPFDDLSLPGDEAPDFDPSRQDMAPGVPPAPSGGDAGGDSGGNEGGSDFDFSAFFDSAPGDIEPPPIDNILPDDFKDGDAPDDAALGNFLDNLTSDAPPETTADIQADLPEDFNTDDFSAVNNLLSGLSDEIAATPEDAADAGLGDFPEGDFNTDDFPLGDLPAGDFPSNDFNTDDFNTDDFNIPDFNTENLPDDFTKDLETDSPEKAQPEETAPKDAVPKDASLDELVRTDNVIDLGGESPDINKNNDAAGLEIPDAITDDLPDDLFGDSSGDQTEMPPADIPAGADADLNLDDLFDNFNTDNLDSGGAGSPLEDMPAADFDASLDMDFDIGTTESPAEQTPDMPDFDGITDTPGGDFGSDSINLESGAGNTADNVVDFGSDDFSLHGLDEILGKSKTEPAVKPAPKKGFFNKKKPEEPAADEGPESDEVEEIQLSQAELDSMLKTLAGYPLNLRVACEELIAERVLIPQQLSKLIRYLKRGASAKETAELAGEILEKKIVIPRSFEKMTGEAYEAEKSSFSYIFVHNFLPLLRLFAFIAAIAISVLYLGYKFIYIPLKAESIYKRGYERIFAGEYQRANELFHDAFTTHRKKKWFYSYAEGFRDERRYPLAEGKYDELLRHYPRDKKGVLDYAGLETNYLLNYEKANRILQQQLLDYAPNDYSGLIAAGDNFMQWADSRPSQYSEKYEDARFAYARLLEKYGWTAPVVERMMTYFIRTDNLKEVLPLRDWFDGTKNRRLSAASLAELGGYLLDKQLEEVKGVPNPYVENIQSVRAMLLQAVRENLELPEAHYHLARYYKNLGNTYEERLTLENAIRAFDLAKQESVRRRLYRVDTHYRYSNLLVSNREFFPAEKQLVSGIELYEDFMSRNLISASPQLGQLYAAKGDLEYFVKSGNMRAALRDYREAERNGWAPPEIQYRMGAAYYQLEDWKNSLEYLFKASADLPLNRRVLHALGNAAYKRGDYYAAQGYNSRLLDVLESQRVRLPVLLPNDRPEYLELGERLMIARNNAGVVYEALANITGNQDFKSRALSMYAESARAWDSITRNPATMERMSLVGSPGAPGINLGFLNANNFLHANNARQPAAYNPEIFIRIDKDALEPSRWEELAPFGGLSE